jgi:hypothetical protein
MGIAVIALTRDFHVLAASFAARLAAVLFSIRNLAITGKMRAFLRRLHLGYSLCDCTSFKWYMGSETCGKAGTRLHNDYRVSVSAMLSRAISDWNSDNLSPFQS